jgi:hypothetical protein
MNRRFHSSYPLKKESASMHMAPLGFRDHQTLVAFLNSACLVEKHQIPILLSFVWPGVKHTLTVLQSSQFKYHWFINLFFRCIQQMASYFKGGKEANLALPLLYNTQLSLLQWKKNEKTLYDEPKMLLSLALNTNHPINHWKISIFSLKEQQHWENDVTLPI